MALEDDSGWVVNKAMRGRGLTADRLAALAGIPLVELDAFLGGTFAPALALRLAPPLGLGPEALAGLPGYQPPATGGPGIARLELPFGEETVNAWLVRKDGAALLFDTGTRHGDCLRALQNLGVPRLDAAFVTHGHRDHIGGLAAVREIAANAYGWHIRGASAATPDETWNFGPLSVRAFDLSGHAIPALGFEISGLGVPVWVSGDALYAGSMGGCPDPATYEVALGNLRAAISSLPGSTLILPGHGPSTTLAAELIHNPFLATTQAGLR